MNIQKFLCKIGICCYHTTSKRYKVLNNEENLCNKRDKFFHLRGYIEINVKHICCRCGKIKFHYYEDFDIDRAMKYPEKEK